MTIVNRRNAILGWGVWQVGKMTAKRKAKQALETDNGMRPGKGAAALAALGVPAFACTPDQFPDLLAVAISKGDIAQWAATVASEAAAPSRVPVADRDHG